MAKSHFFLKFEGRIINYILFGALLNFFNNESFQIDKTTIRSKILLHDIYLFYFLDYLFLLQKYFLLLRTFWNLNLCFVFFFILLWALLFLKKIN